MRIWLEEPPMVTLGSHKLTDLTAVLRHCALCTATSVCGEGGNHLSYIARSADFM